MTDLEYVNKAKQLLDNAYYTQTSLAKLLGISREKLRRIAKDNELKLPLPLNASQAATLGKKSGKIKWGNKFRLAGSPRR